MTPEDFSDVFEQLAQDRIRYVVVSGAAVVLHGHPRSILDLDLVIDPQPDEASRAWQTLTLAGFVPTLPLPLNLVTVMRMFDQREREIDLFVRYHIPFAEMWDDARPMQIGNATVRVISLDHLLKAKRVSGREHHLLDIAALLGQQPEGLRRK